ncbi:MAG: acyl carrier protein [Coriobacteriia bacterium]|nr:acyl carrier protein [Coriobacteriia bacterium]
MTAKSFETIRIKLAEQLEIDYLTILPESHIFDDLGADSLDAVELIIALEEEFNLTIEPEDVEELETVGDVALLVDKLVWGES